MSQKKLKISVFDCYDEYHMTFDREYDEYKKFEDINQNLLECLLRCVGQKFEFMRILLIKENQEKILIKKEDSIHSLNIDYNSGDSILFYCQYFCLKDQGLKDFYDDGFI